MNPLIFFITLCSFFHFYEIFAPSRPRPQKSGIQDSTIYRAEKDKLMLIVNITQVTVTVLEICFYLYLARAYPWLPIQILSGLFSVRQLVKLILSKKTKTELENCETYQEFQDLDARKREERQKNHRERTVKTIFHCLSIVFYIMVIAMAI